MRIVIAALTYRRPDDLAALIPELVAQAQSSSEDVEVLVVDNDPAASAQPAVAAVGPPVRYHHAAEPGIAAARNAALDAAGDADLLVFIDDDERPAVGWLENLLTTWRATHPAAVVGPVQSEFVAQPDSWISAGRFFERRRLPTGTRITTAATNNLLLDLRFITRIGLRFDERFGLTGGEDTIFTRALHAAGGRIVWCAEAMVTDVVPPARVTREWVLARAYRSGNSHALTAVALTPSPLARSALRARLVVQGLVRILGGSLRVLVGVLTRRVGPSARGSRTLARGRGMLAGVLGSTYAEYGRDEEARPS